MELLRGSDSLCYVAFDALWLDGQDLRELPLQQRKWRLRAILPKRSPIVCEPVSLDGKGRKLFATVQVHDLEGIVAKRKRDPYGPRTRWWKIKNPAYSQAEGRGDLFERWRSPLRQRRLPIDE